MLSLARGWRNLLLCLGPISPLVALGILFTYKEMGIKGYSAKVSTPWHQYQAWHQMQ